MKETDYREIENAIAATLRVFLESKQKLNSFERSCQDSLAKIMSEVVKRRAPRKAVSEGALNEGR